MSDEFDRLGEDAVRDNLAAGRFSSRRAVRAREWLRRIDQSRSEAAESRKEASNLEQRTTTRREKTAAIIAAIAAIMAATWAIVSGIIDRIK